MVVRGSACEAASCTSLRGTPASRAAVMKACLRVWGPNRLGDAGPSSHPVRDPAGAVTVEAQAIGTEEDGVRDGNRQALSSERYSAALAPLPGNNSRHLYEGAGHRAGRSAEVLSWEGKLLVSRPTAPVSGGHLESGGTSTRPKLKVTADGKGVASHVGTRLLVDMADATGLTVPCPRPWRRSPSGAAP